MGQAARDRRVVNDAHSVEPNLPVRCRKVATASQPVRGAPSADRFGLLKTGGSDFHGSNKKDIRLGVANGRRIPFSYMESLLKRHQELRRAG